MKTIWLCSVATLILAIGTPSARVPSAKKTVMVASQPGNSLAEAEFVAARKALSSQAGIPGNHEAGVLRASPDVESACPEGIDSDWWGTVQKNIAESEYFIRYQDGVGAHQSPNRAQNLRFTYRGDGFEAEPRTYEQDSPASNGVEPNPPWTLGMRLSAWGREDRLSVFHAGELRADGNRAIAEGRGVTVTYQNDREGMRQDFLVRERPPGSGPLLLWLNLELDNVDMEVEGNGRGVTFVRTVSGGARIMSYGDLEVRDADGRLLEARMVKEHEELCSIVVDDAGAVYPVLVDPLSSSPDWTAEGNQDYASFGVSVATAGDVNGDGYSDVIVGAYEYDNDQWTEGRAFVYHGSSVGLADSPSWITEGNQNGAQFGRSVATAGDVNGDGYSDVIIGAYYYDNDQTDEGRVYVYHGGPAGLAASPAWTDESNQADAYFGVSVATAGDVNGDGYSDVIIGANGYDITGGDEGRAYVYHGGPSGLAADPAWWRSSYQTNAQYGYSVATAGDVNGDGYSDIIVGAFAYDNAYSAQGKAYVYHGSSTGLPFSHAWTIEGDQPSAYFGISVATAGDVNGDGYSDVIIGASSYYNDQFDEGRAYVYRGSSAGLAASPSWIAEGNQASAYFGNSVASAGDVNGDGYSDVIVGAYYFDSGETGEGRAYVYYGSSTGLAAYPMWADEGNQNWAHFGFSVATAGDVNGDGFSDIIVGADQYTNGQTREGGAFVYHGGPAGLYYLPSWSAEGNQANASFGWSVHGAGDVNGDGFSDVIVGAHSYNSGLGRVFVYHGSSTGPAVTPDWTVDGDQIGAQFGVSVAGAGDVNGDGYSDVIVGANGYDNDIENQGRVYVYYGNSVGLATTPAWTAEGDQSGASFGNPVSDAGDVNGDGYSDVIVGTYTYDNGQTDEGRVYVYHGGPTGLSGSPSWSVESNQATAYFGVSVASAGDVNGDGYSDVIVGAHFYDNGEYNEGRAFVYHGSPTGLGVSQSWTGESNQESAYFGISVATAGDVNGDGYSDVIVGARLYDNGQLGEGGAFVYLGGSAGLAASADWIGESNQIGANFGFSVGGAGDVNGDGYSDVIVGAYSYDNGQMNEGRAYAYHGSDTGVDISPAWIVESNQGGALFGYSVASAGDVNGDGYSDAIVGAHGHDSGEDNEGRAYVYYGNYGDGLHVLPRQWRTDLATPVVPALKTRSQSAAGLGLLGRTFFGRNDLKVRFEVKPLGTSFDGTGLVSTGWIDPSLTGTAVSEVIGGLSNDTMYRWRARVGYRLSDGAPQPFGRWIYQPYNGGLGEADFQISDDDLPPATPDLHITKLGPTQCRLWWYTVVGATSYDLYRETTAFFTPGSPWQTLAAPDTSCDFSAGVGNAAINYYFLCRSVGAWGESGDSNRVGEFDFDGDIPVILKGEQQQNIGQRR